MASGPGEGCRLAVPGGGRRWEWRLAASSAFSPGVGVSAQALAHVN